MCDDTASSNDNIKIDTKSAIGLWLDTFPKIEGVLTSDLEIKFNIKIDSTYEIKMKEVDTEKILFIHSGIWNENDSHISINGNYCQVLDKDSDSLIENEELCDTLIDINKKIDIEPSPDTWEMVVKDMEFLLLGMNLDIGELEKKILLTLKFYLNRED